MFRGKIFGIGFHKTATTSLGTGLKILGYRVCGPVGVRNQNISTEVDKIAFPLVEKYDAFQDNPWPLLYRSLDERYPGSKFILTIRSPADWIRSVERHFGGSSTPMREWIYGVGDPLTDRDVYMDRYRRHNAEVIAYFRSRPEDLLVLEITAGEGWEKLCPFLDVPVPSQPFPRDNTVVSRRGKSVRKKLAAFVRGLSERGKRG